MKTAILATLAALLLAGCSGAKREPSVPWGDHPAILKTRLTNAALGGDCKKLKREFDYAADSSDDTRSRTGRSNTELMRYIDQLMTEAGCYK